MTKFREYLPPVIPEYDPFGGPGTGGGSKIYGDVRTEFGRYEDAFNTPTIKTTGNSMDLPSYYDYSPERYRLYLNDTRTTPADIPNQFTDENEAFRISPDAGNEIHFHTAEKPRYIVGFEGQASMAAKMDTELGAGDTVEWGMNSEEGGDDNGAYFEINGDNANRVVIESAGNVIASEEFEYPDGIDERTPIRYEIQFNWYNVGRYLFSVSYTDSTEPKCSRSLLAKTAETPGRPSTTNL